MTFRVIIIVKDNHSKKRELIMRVLFIGGTRFIGRWAVVQLVEAGHDVAVFHRGETSNDLPDSVTHIYGDIANLDDYRDTFRQFAPDVAVHMRVLEQGEATQMMRVLRGVAERLLVISSVDVYRAWGRLINSEPAEIQPMPLTENSPLREEKYPYRNEINKDWRYYYDKISVEQIAMQFPRPAATVLRLPMVYGPYDYQQRILNVVKRMADGRSHILLDSRTYNWTPPRGYIENIAHAMVLAITNEKASRRIYHVGNRHSAALTEADWVRAIGEAAGWGGEVVSVPFEKLPPNMRMNPHEQSVTLDISRIEDELGYSEIVSLEDGLRRAVKWDMENLVPKMEPLNYALEDKLIAQL